MLRFLYFFVVGLFLIQRSTSQNVTLNNSSTVSSTTYISSNISTTQSLISNASQISAVSTTSFIPNPVTNLFWVKTVINMDLTENLANVSVTADLETRLSTAYNIGYGRVVNVRRRKRSVTIGVNTLYLVSSSRASSTSKTTTLVYFVQAPDFVPPSTVISNMNQLTLQEMSIVMGRPVTIVAALNDPSSQSLSTDNQLWIFGAVFGSLAASTFLIWLILFIHRRCLIPFDEPLLAEKSSIDLESQTDLQIKNIEEEQTEIVLPKLQKAELAKGPPRLIGSENYNDEPNYVESNNYERIIEQEINEQRQPKEIIVKHVYENMENASNFESVSSRSRSYRLRHLSTISSSGRRIRYLDSKKRRKKRRIKVHETDFEITTDIQPEEIASLQDPGLMTVNETLKLEDSVKSEKDGVVIVVKPVEESSSRYRDDDVLHSIKFVDKYPVKHIWPVYTDNVTIPDTTLNLMDYKVTDQMENDTQILKKRNSRKENMRTLNPTS